MKYISRSVKLMLLFGITVFCLGVNYGFGAATLSAFCGVAGSDRANIPSAFCGGVGFVSASAVGENDFQIANGVLTAYRGTDTMVIVPDGVVEIGKAVFKDSKVVEVILPSTVTGIGEDAFWECTELEKVELPESVTKIGKWAFFGCTKLEDIELPDGITEIEDCAFWGCEKLDIELPESLTEIGGGAFRECGLTKVVWPSSITKINTSVFKQCTKLKSVQLPESLEVIGAHAFEECYSLEKVVIPENVIRIASEAFAYCYKLKKIVIQSDKITTVYRHPFLFHAPDRKVVFKKQVSEKYKKQFKYQAYITKGAVLYHKTSSSTVDMCGVKYTKKGKLTVPEKVGKYTVTGVKKSGATFGFVIESRHTGITEVVLPDTIEELGNYVFMFARFTKIKFPKNLTYIGEGALLEVKLKKINLPNKLEYIGYEAFARSLPDNVKDLPKSILIPKSVKSIDSGNFGYYYEYPDDADAESWVKIDDYTVKGYKGSYAQEYANMHGLNFVAVDS